MNKLLILLFLFSTGSVTGWVIELFFRRYLDPVERKKKKWVNPGFFVGPYLPIYGSGLIVLYGLGHIKLPTLGVTHPVLEKLIIFIIMAACMTLLEFITGMIFINHLHLQLWDYSSYWGNIKGVIWFSLFLGEDFPNKTSEEHQRKATHHGDWDKPFVEPKAD